jgi:transcriptional regulator with XRE-family HTH domain
MAPGRLPPFGSLLRDLRRAAGLTQEELAERARVGVRTLRDLETGRTARPQRSTVELLAMALELEEAERKDFVSASRGWPGPARIPRQRTRQAVLASWRVLTPDEQDSLCWLAVFQGRWTVRLASSLLAGRGGGPTDADAAGALVDRLVSLGLVSTAPGLDPPRFWLRDAVRLFVSQRPHVLATFARAKDRHALVMADVAGAAGAATAGGTYASGDLFVDLDADLRAAIRHLHSRDADERP